MSTKEQTVLNGQELGLDVEKPEEFTIMVDFVGDDFVPPTGSPAIPAPASTGGSGAGKRTKVGSAGTHSAGTRSVGAPSDGSSGAGSPSAGTRSAKAAEQIEARSKNAISAAMSTIRQMALETDLMRKGIPGGAQPRMVKVKFGVNLNFEVGAVLAKSGVGATLEVELEWARASDDILRVLHAATDVEAALSTPEPSERGG